jgi:hypothetical protein
MMRVDLPNDFDAEEFGHALRDDITKYAKGWGIDDLNMRIETAFIDD